jgi:hypothetical protein
MPWTFDPFDYSWELNPGFVDAEQGVTGQNVVSGASLGYQGTMTT